MSVIGEEFYIFSGGPAEQNGLLRVGDVILAVNHHNLTGISYKQALKKLRGLLTRLKINLSGELGLFRHRSSALHCLCCLLIGHNLPSFQ